MANLRAIRNRVRSVRSTQKITKAMKMVAAARLRRAQERVQKAVPYAEKITELLQSVGAASGEATHPYLRERPVEKRILIVLSSDRGLCGAFNSSLLRRLEKETTEGVPTELIPVGRKAISFVNRRHFPLFRAEEGFWGRFSYGVVSTVMSELGTAFLEGKVDRVDVLYNQFVSVMTQRPTLTTLFPLPPAKEASQEGNVPYLFEPPAAEMLGPLVTRAVDTRFYLACLHSLASEYGARMSAMDSATRNAGDMIDRLTLQMNRVRQAAITRELVEIISGAEALK